MEYGRVSYAPTLRFMKFMITLDRDDDGMWIAGVPLHSWLWLSGREVADSFGKHGWHVARQRGATASGREDPPFLTRDLPFLQDFS